MRKSMFVLPSISLLVIFALAACAGQPPPPTAPPATSAPPTAAPPTMAQPTAAPPTQPAAPTTTVASTSGTIKGKKVCYLLPTLANPFLNGLSTSVKAKAAGQYTELCVKN
jgi:hypothetical protein